MWSSNLNDSSPSIEMEPLCTALSPRIWVMCAWNTKRWLANLFCKKFNDIAYFPSNISSERMVLSTVSPRHVRRCCIFSIRVAIYYRCKHSLKFHPVSIASSEFRKPKRGQRRCPMTGWTLLMAAITWRFAVNKGCVGIQLQGALRNLSPNRGFKRYENVIKFLTQITFNFLKIKNFELIEIFLSFCWSSSISSNLTWRTIFSNEINASLNKK